MRELYVYYRVAPARADAARAVVTEAQAGLRTRHPGLVARLLRRADAADPAASQTWMETYALPGSAEGVDAAVQAQVEAALAATLGLIDGVRHAEAFSADAAEADARSGRAALPPAQRGGA